MSTFEDFLTQCDEITSFEENLKETDASGYNESAIEAEKNEIQTLWVDWKDAYKTCIADPECNKKNKEILKTKKKIAHESYIKCINILGEWKERIKVVPTTFNQKSSSSISVPPCDTEVFQGDYVSWPSFRDLFTAIYINNKKLSSVEKLYHLFQKTSGEAREINRNIPLTAEGFTIAWDNLKNQYENKRILINTQLRTLFNLAHCGQESASSLKKLQRDVTNCISVLELYKIDVKSWDPIFVFQCSSKLPKLTLSLWEQSLTHKTEMPRWEDLNKFLTERFQALESVSDITGSNSNQCHQSSRPKFNQYDKSRQFKVHHTKVDQNNCKLCKGSHTIKSCPKFLSMDFRGRLNAVKRENRCINCLAQGHRAVDCRSQSCSKCKAKHHILLHKEVIAQNNSESQNLVQVPTSHENLSSGPTTSASGRIFHTSATKRTMLATACINVWKDGVSYKIRALIDPCSDDTFISSRIQKMLKLPTSSVSADISGLGGGHLTNCSKIAYVSISSTKNDSFSMELEAFVVPEVTGNIPLETVCIGELPDLDLADQKFYQSGPVDMLLGGNVYPAILLSGVKKNVLGSLLAQETVFGWILTGPAGKLEDVQRVRVSHCTRVSVQDQLAKFWEIEEVPKIPIVSLDDKKCEEIFLSTTCRGSDGRYTVDLPFRSDLSFSFSSKSSRYIALTQFLRNERSLMRNPSRKADYDNVILEYLALGHMEKLEGFTNYQECYYLPHHGVFKPDSATTKLRVVFNASCPSVNGKSLNDALYVGPTLQKDIISLVLNWRMYKYVFNADISKMYRQIWINPKHAKYQRILFRPSSGEEITDYQLKTVTFGVNCAPYLALRTLLKLADDEEYRFPIGSKILRKNMYVDDALVGVHSVRDGLKAREELINILKAAGFELRKWTSNSKEILDGLTRTHLLNEDFLELGDKSSAKTLGIRWNAVSDSFYFVLEKIEERSSYTKRQVLSIIAKIFDPLGWLSPIVVTAKIFMQQLWVDDIGWDDPLKPLSLMNWKSFVSSSKGIEDIRIPRWVDYSPDCMIEVHGFCDSSESAYAATLYLRVEVNGNIYSNLLVGKSKVAPLKKMSLPRLELCGALLLAELVDSVVPQLDIPKAPLLAWSDSTIVLSWLKKPSYTWTTFVANRVAIIQEKIGDVWHHVPTKDNPADLATRGRTPSELKECELWWYGPSWLKHDKSEWPIGAVVPETTLESKISKVHLARSAVEEDVLERFSRLSTAIHAVTYCFRFVYRTHPGKRKIASFKSISLSSEEICSARYRLMSLSQRIYFPSEFDCLMNNRKLESNSPLVSLNPFLDKNQLIRANGRLSSTLSLPYNERYPIILAYQSKFASLYVDHVHRQTNHGGIQLTLAATRLECWIIRGRNLVKANYRRCTKCVLAQKKRQHQLMAALPPERTTFGRPFSTSGVDFAGPVEIKTFNGRGCRISKGYICLFVCFVTKAIHLEPVSDLSTPAFIAALSRFVARRGCPLHIYSDNGKNFVGADRELKSHFAKIVSEMKDDAITRYGFQKLEWHFIPASAPHMGGLWEAGVKSCKTHLKKISGQIRHTFEEFSTILAVIESCLNSRPLTQLSDNIDDLSALTPGHFLIGGSLLSPAEPEEVENKTSLQNRWRRVKLVSQEFCRRWKMEYLKELHKRTKWKKSQDNLQVNDLVVLHKDSMAPNEWRLGRVVKLHKGQDDRVRVVDLRTQNGMSFNDDYKCPLCDTRHSLRQCRSFLHLHPTLKLNYVRIEGFCVNCLGMSHEVRRCPLKKGCHTCNLPHHTLLHPLDTLRKSWLSMTAEVYLYSKGFVDPAVKVRVLLDPRAQDSTIHLGGPLPKFREIPKSMIQVVLTSTTNSVRTYSTGLRKSIRGRRTEPFVPLDLRCVRRVYSKKDVADPNFEKPGEISVVLGQDASRGIYLGLPYLEAGLPYAQNTIFGWVFFGEAPQKL
ncbi:uncharacterized protein LOC133327189 [Musca vetustissima]|uniref:uncharacterized protein LOC133327189 n=1 Tax=Musca vetustissima TaxID=27455 RepID=UPI002AB78A23|nr:uncharacterized protein LOC133327189 [Musca vetustissima]